MYLYVYCIYHIYLFCFIFKNFATNVLVLTCACANSKSILLYIYMQPPCLLPITVDVRAHLDLVGVHMCVYSGACICRCARWRKSLTLFRSTNSNLLLVGVFIKLILLHSVTWPFSIRHHFSTKPGQSENFYCSYRSRIKSSN